MTQTILDFAVESTDEKLTPQAGVILLGEYLKEIRLQHLTNRHFPLPGSNRGYDPFVYLNARILMLHGGGRVLEDIRILKSDQAMRTLLHMDHIPEADTIGKWLNALDCLAFMA